MTSPSSAPDAEREQSELLARFAAALKDISEYTGESPVPTDWQGIVRDLGRKAREALAGRG